MNKPVIGDKIRYGAYGECVISDIRFEVIGGKLREFFVLSQCNSSSTILVPIEKADCFKEIKNALSVDEIKALSLAKGNYINWDSDDKTRKSSFIEVFERGDVSEIAGVLLDILSRQKHLKTEKKKLRTVDFTALKHCEQVLFNEFSRTIDLQIEDVTPILTGELEPYLKQT